MPRNIKVGEQGKKRIMLTPKERGTHMHVIGASGKGKSKALENLIRNDIVAGHSVVLLDPHGGLYNSVVDWLARSNMQKHRTVHLINPSEGKFSVGFNPLRVKECQQITQRVDRVVESFAKVWGKEDLNGKPRLKKILSLVFYALAYNNLTLMEAKNILSPSNIGGLRQFLTNNLEHGVYQQYWAELNALPPKVLSDYFDSADSRFLGFLTTPVVRAMLGATENSIDLRHCMDNKEIVLINLQPSEEHLSEQNSQLIGTLISDELFSVASSRPEALARTNPCYYYIDECYRFLNDDIESMLNETRKRGLSVTLVHHYLEQLKAAGDNIYHAVMTNAQTKLIFGGTSDADAVTLAYEVFRSELDVDQVETKLSRPMPTGEFLKDHMHGVSMSIGSGSGSGRGVSDGVNSATAIAQATDTDGNNVGGPTTISQDGTSGVETENTFSTTSDTYSRTKNEVFVPIYAVMPTAMKSMEKIVHEAVVRIRGMGEQFAILKQVDKRSLNIKIPFIRDVHVLPEKVTNFVEQSNEKGGMALPLDSALHAVVDRQKALVESAKNTPLVLEFDQDDEDRFLE